MMGSPTSYRFLAIGWGIPSRWKTMRTSDELPRPRQLAEGGQTVPQTKSARRASFWHAQSVRCTCPNHQLRPGKGLYARIGGQLDLAGAFLALDDEAQVALYRAHTEPLGTWAGTAARTTQLAA
jgi:hypothetical protein